MSPEESTKRHFAGRAERQKANGAASGGHGLHLRFHRAFADEYQAHALIFEHSHGRNQRLPRAVEAQISRVYQSETEIAANLARNGIVRRRAGLRECQCRRERSPRAPDRLLWRRCGRACLRPARSTRAAWRSAQRCIASQRAVKLPGAHNRAAHGHVRIHVANVVDEWPSRKARDERAGDALDGRIGHGQHDVRANR